LTIIFLIRVSFLNSLGNKIVNDPIFLKKIEEYIRNTKSESVFFTLYDEEKTAMFVMDISSPDHRYDACELLLMQDGKVHLDMI
jgi:hypothetical protein